MAEAVKKKKTFDLTTLGIKMGPVKSDPYCKTWLIYGNPGAGKTRLAASAVEVEKLGPVLHIDFEAGTSSLEGRYADNERLTIARPEHWKQAEALINTLLTEDHGYHTVIVDTVGEMMATMRGYLEDERRMTGWDLWGEVAKQTVSIIKQLHKSGMNVVTLAHTETKKQKGDDVVLQPQFLGNKTAEEAPKIFDIIAYLYVEEEEESGDPVRILQSEGINDVLAKDRSDRLPVLLGNPTMPRITELLVSGKLNKGRDE